MYGLTGNIGDGKSMFGSLLRECGATVLDCDEIAKEIMARPEHRTSVNLIVGIEAFPSGTLDRKAVADIIFDDDAKRQALNEFVGVLLWREVQRARREAAPQSKLIVESALHFEMGWDERFCRMIVVRCPLEIKLQRLAQKRGIDREEALRRLRCQLPIEEKVARADFVIDTDCKPDELKRRAEKLYGQLNA